MNVLFLSAWYPNRYDAMEGLFVRKHAQAAKLYCDVKVLFVCADKTISSFEIVDTVVHGVNEIVVYYPIRPDKTFHKIIKSFRYLKAYWVGYKYLKDRKYSPDILHVNVLTRTGVIAYINKLWKKTPYVVMEHWSRYLPQNLSYKGFLHKKITELVVRNASAVMAVSELLRNSMEQVNLKNSRFEIVHNVVDDFFMKPGEWKGNKGKKRILHVSCFDEKAKNVMGLLRALEMLSRKRSDFELIIAGTGKDFASCVDYSRSLGLSSENLKFLGEVSPHDVADLFRGSDFFVLFSNYETASVAVAESLVSGVPVVTTPVGITPEMIHEGNGILVDCRDERMLCEKMNDMLEHCQDYDKKAIQAEAIGYFSFEHVGRQLYSIYCSVSAKSNGQ